MFLIEPSWYMEDIPDSKDDVHKVILSALTDLS